MTPNLFVLGKTALSPHKWFTERKHSSLSVKRATEEDSKIEHWDYPEPGYYEHEEGRGWYLIAKDGASPGSIKVPRTKVTYSRVLKRWLHEADMVNRKRRGRFLDESISREEVGFFRLDNGVAWVNSSDSQGNHLDGPYTLYCIDAETKRFRIMKKKDDPIHQQKQSRHASLSTEDHRRHSSSSGDSDDIPPNHRKESSALKLSRPSSSRHGSSRAVSRAGSAVTEPPRLSETLPLSTTRLHSISG